MAIVIILSNQKIDFGCLINISDIYCRALEILIKRGGSKPTMLLYQLTDGTSDYSKQSNVIQFLVV